MSAPPASAGVELHETEVYAHPPGFRARCLDCDWHGPRRPIRWDAVCDAVAHEDDLPRSRTADEERDT